LEDVEAPEAIIGECDPTLFIVGNNSELIDDSVISSGDGNKDCRIVKSD
jgi:hypothetical protein